MFLQSHSDIGVFSFFPLFAQQADTPEEKKGKAKKASAKKSSGSKKKTTRGTASKAKKTATKKSSSTTRSRRKKSLREADALITGFPGFLAKRLLLELIDSQPKTKFVFLVQKSMLDLANGHLGILEIQHPSLKGRWEVFTGDITDKLLGLSEKDYKALCDRIEVVWHLAAIYNLEVSEEVAYRVNVEGTGHVLDFCEACKRFQRLNYVSTCYVSGERTGVVYEDELDEGQSHKNHYESTKFWAEVEVQKRSKALPTVIFRPAIVVGDSETGQTDKFDGPYVMMCAFKNFPNWLPLARVGQAEALINLVPVDFVARAMAHIGLQDGVEGQTYQLADPNPMRSRDVIALILASMNKAPALVSIPERMANRLLDISRFKKWLGISRESFAYINHDVQYDTSRTQHALMGTSIRCPHISTYMQTLVDYFEQHSRG